MHVSAIRLKHRGRGANRHAFGLCLQLDLHINDSEFAQALVNVLLRLMRAR